MAQGASVVLATYNINYRDCSSPQAIKTYNKDSVCNKNPVDNEVNLHKTFTILQKPSVRRVKGFSCRLETSMYHFKCGAWGHLKWGSVPELFRVQEVTIPACQHMIFEGKYTIPGTDETVPLTLGQPAYIPATLKGALILSDDTISCLGESVRVKGTIHTNTVIMAEYKILIRPERFLISDSVVEAQDDL